MSNLRPALVLVALSTVLLGLVFPLAFVGIGQAVFSWQAGGSLVRHDGQVIGSALIGQDFADPRYFASRPSATTGTDPADPSKTIDLPDNAAASGASNLGPTSKALIDRVKAAVARLGPGPVPADAVTTSASGVDPDISPANALRQVPRIARLRRLPEGKLQQLVESQVRGRTFGILGEKRVNVLALNMRLDALSRDQGLAAR